MDILLIALAVGVFAGVHVWFWRDNISRHGEIYRTNAVVRAQIDAVTAASKHLVLLVISVVAMLVMNEVYENENPDEDPLGMQMIAAYLWSFPVLALGHVAVRFIYAGQLQSNPSMTEDDRSGLAGTLFGGYVFFAVASNILLWVLALIIWGFNDPESKNSVVWSMAMNLTAVLIIPIAAGLIFSFTSEFFRNSGGVIWSGNPASTITGNLRGHTAVFGGGCSCGKPQVCTVAEAQQLSEEFRDLNTEGYYDLMAEQDDHQQRGHQ